MVLELGLMRMAVADQWKVSGAFDQSMEYDDNIGLRVEKTPAFGYSMRPSVRADWSTPVLALGVSGRGDIRRYDDQQWDCDNFGVVGEQRYSRRNHVFSLDGDYSQNCSYSQQTNDTGLLIPNNQSENYALNPAWSWQMTPLDRLSLSPGYTRTSYSNFGTDSNGLASAYLNNNESYSVSLAEEHVWDKRLASTANVFFSSSSFTNASSASTQSTFSQDVFGFQLGSQYAISRLWMLNANGGGRWVQSPGSDSGLLFGETYNVALSYKGKLDAFSLNFSRSVSPSSFGQIQDITSFGMRYDREISRELSFNLNGSYSQNQAIGQSLNQLGQERTYFNATAELVWTFSRDWRLSASYRYRMQDYGNNTLNTQQAGVIDSNAIMLHLNYNWDGLRVSR